MRRGIKAGGANGIEMMAKLRSQIRLMMVLASTDGQ